MKHSMFVLRTQGGCILLAIDKFFIVGRFFRSVIMNTPLLPIKQLKNILFVSCLETDKAACVKL